MVTYITKTKICAQYSKMEITKCAQNNTTVCAVTSVYMHTIKLYLMLNGCDTVIKLSDKDKRVRQVCMPNFSLFQMFNTKSAIQFLTSNHYYPLDKVDK